MGSRSFLLVAGASAAVGPHKGSIKAAWRGFTTQSDRSTFLGFTGGNRGPPARQSVAADVNIRLGEGTTQAASALAQTNPQIVNCG